MAGNFGEQLGGHEGDFINPIDGHLQELIEIEARPLIEAFNKGVLAYLELPRHAAADDGAAQSLYDSYYRDFEFKGTKGDINAWMVASSASESVRQARKAGMSDDEIRAFSQGKLDDLKAKDEEALRELERMGQEFYREFGILDEREAAEKSSKTGFLARTLGKIGIGSK